MNQIAALDLSQATPHRLTTAIQAPMNFIRRQFAKPAFHSRALSDGTPQFFFESENQSVPVENLREFAGSLSLDHEGFELLADETKVSDLYDDEAIKNAYLPEIEALLTRKFGASKVVTFDATRRSDRDTGAHNPDGNRGPVTQVHVDYTATSGPQRAADILGKDEFARLTASGARILQVNVWRPIRGPVQRSHLALADASSIEPDDLIATDQIFPDRVGEIYMMAHTPSQRWYYAPEMTRDEVLLIKGWDSLEDGRARFTPHGAFNPLDVNENAPPRESIEVRTFVVIE
jgi:hypothetical protein